MHEIDELRLQAYDFNKLYKQEVHRYHDKKIVKKKLQTWAYGTIVQFKIETVLGKLKSK